MTRSLETRIGPLPLETAVEAYLRVRTGSPGAGEDLSPEERRTGDAAEDAVRNLAFDGPADEAWEVVLEILRRAPDDDLGFHAAGVLEDLVSEQGAALVDRIEAEAERDPRFHRALGCIWLSQGELPDDVLARVVRASGDVIRILPPHEELARKAGALHPAHLQLPARGAVRRPDLRAVTRAAEA